jgi:hypothetical protein
LFDEAIKKAEKYFSDADEEVQLVSNCPIQSYDTKNRSADKRIGT